MRVSSEIRHPIKTVRQRMEELSFRKIKNTEFGEIEFFQQIRQQVVRSSINEIF